MAKKSINTINIIEQIEELYSEHSTMIQTKPKEVQWEVEAAPRDVKNGTASSSDHN